MSNASIPNKIFDLCNEFYKQKKFFENNFNESINICYLIESKLIDNLKKQINYDKFETYLNNDKLSRESFKEEIKKKFKKNTKIKMETILIPDKFNNSKDLLKALNKKKFYCFTNFMSVSKICENVEINNFPNLYIHKMIYISLSNYYLSNI